MESPKQRILVVDDEPAALALLSRRLGAQGYEVVVAEDGQLALAEIAHRRPDLLILDIMMPRLSGFDVIRDLRGRPETADLPIIAISAQGRGIGKMLPSDQRPDAFYPKPIDFHDLIAEIDMLLRVGRGNGDGASGRGMVLAFVGAKGGVGTTTLAANLAAQLARGRWPTIFLETAAFHGTAATILGLNPERRLDGLPLASPEQIRPESVATVALSHASGLRVLLGPSGSQPPPPAESVVALLEALRTQARAVVVDLDEAMDVYGQVTLRMADRICVVTGPQAASLERAALLLRTIEGWGVRSPAIHLAVNRQHEEGVYSGTEVAQRAGRPAAADCPPVGAACYEATARGRLVIDHPRAEPFKRALASLAAALLAAETSQPSLS